MLQTHYVKYRINTFRCQLCSHNQALVYFIIYNAHVVVYSMISDINCWQFNSNPAASPKKKQCSWNKGEDESEKLAEKAATRGLHLPGPAQPLTLPEAKNCEPVYSPLLDYRTVNLQCLVVLVVIGAHSNWIGYSGASFGALPHSGCSSLRGRRPWFIQLRHMDSNAIQYCLSVGEIIRVQAYHRLLTALSSMITR